MSNISICMYYHTTYADMYSMALVMDMYSGLGPVSGYSWQYAGTQGKIKYSGTDKSQTGAFCSKHRLWETNAFFVWWIAQIAKDAILCSISMHCVYLYVNIKCTHSPPNLWKRLDVSMVHTKSWHNCKVSDLPITPKPASLPPFFSKISESVAFNGFPILQHFFFLDSQWC